MSSQIQSSRELMSRLEMRRVLARMAHEIIERNHGAENLILVGIPTRGVHISKRIAESIEQFEHRRPITARLDPSGHRDDWFGSPSESIRRQISNGMENIDVSGIKVVIVDDVFHTGRTARAALDALMQSGRPSLVQFAALINRGHRELPISPDFVGKNIPTSRSERVHVKLTEVDGEDSVAIFRELDGKTARAGRN